MADHVAWGDKSPGCSLPAAWLYRLVTLQNFPSLCILYRDIEWEMPPTPPPITLGPELGWCLGMIGTFKRWIFVGESTSLGVPFCIYSLIPLSRLSRTPHFASSLRLKVWSADSLSFLLRLLAATPPHHDKLALWNPTPKYTFSSRSHFGCMFSHSSIK